MLFHEKSRNQQCLREFNLGTTLHRHLYRDIVQELVQLETASIPKTPAYSSEILHIIYKEYLTDLARRSWFRPRKTPSSARLHPELVRPQLSTPANSPILRETLVKGKQPRFRIKQNPHPLSQWTRGNILHLLGIEKCISIEIV